MSDYNSALPIRTEGDATEKVQVRILDKSVDANQLAVNADGSVNITDNGASLTVDAVDLDIRDLAFATDKVDVSGSSVDVTATDLDIRDLDAAQDNVAISDGTDTLAINADGSINITDNGGSLTVDAIDLDIRNLVFATDKVDVSGSAVTAVVTATDLDIRDLSHTQDSVKVGDGTDFLAVNADGSINVAITNSVPGSSVNDYNTAAALAAAASSNHDYTVTALKTLNFNQVWASASGKLRVQVQVETGVATGVFITRFVAFNSTAAPVIDLDIENDIQVAAGVRVRVIRTNLDNQAQDVYSTIGGSEV